MKYSPAIIGNGLRAQLIYPLLTYCEGLLLAFSGVFGHNYKDGVPKEVHKNGASLPQSPDIDEHDEY